MSDTEFFKNLFSFRNLSPLERAEEDLKEDEDFMAKVREKEAAEAEEKKQEEEDKERQKAEGLSYRNRTVLERAIDGLERDSRLWEAKEKRQTPIRPGIDDNERGENGKRFIGTQLNVQKGLPASKSTAENQDERRETFFGNALQQRGKTPDLGNRGDSSAEEEEKAVKGFYFDSDNPQHKYPSFKKKDNSPSLNSNHKPSGTGSVPEQNQNAQLVKEKSFNCTIDIKGNPSKYVRKNDLAADVSLQDVPKEFQKGFVSALACVLKEYPNLRSDLTMLGRTTDQESRMARYYRNAEIHKGNKERDRLKAEKDKNKLILSADPRNKDARNRIAEIKADLSKKFSEKEIKRRAEWVEREKRKELIADGKEKTAYYHSNRYLSGIFLNTEKTPNDQKQGRHVGFHEMGHLLDKYAGISDEIKEQTDGNTTIDADGNTTKNTKKSALQSLIEKCFQNECGNGKKTPYRCTSKEEYLAETFADCWQENPSTEAKQICYGIDEAYNKAKK